MGSGAYLAAKSEREVYEAEINRERLEIETDPESEREELELFYQLKGFTPEESRMLGDQKFVMKHTAIDPHVADRWAEELTTDFLGPAARDMLSHRGAMEAQCHMGSR